MAAACSKSEAPESPQETTNEIPRRWFPSGRMLRQKIAQIEMMLETDSGQEHFVRTKSGESWPLFEEFDVSLLSKDPILKAELGNSLFKTKDGGFPSGLTLYELAGYDTLVPNRALAALLNVRGEVQVGDTIYKISPKGTYFFHENLYDDFVAEYHSPEAPITTPGIYSEPTFNTYTGPGTRAPVTPAPGYDIPAGEPYYLTGYDWSSSRVYDISAKTWLGKLFESFFGSNKRQHAYFNDNSRIRAGLYDYNYVIYRECGATVRFQRKYGGFAWLQQQADELFLGWKNIIFKTKYETPLPAELRKCSGSKLLAKDVQRRLPFVDETGPTAYLLGLDITSEQIKKFIGFSSKQIFQFLKSKLGSNVDLSGQKCFNLFTDKEVYTVFLGGFKIGRNTGRFVKVFDKSWLFSMPEVNMLNLPSWESSAMRLLASLFGNKPQTRLVHAEVGAAGYADGRLKGMRFVKD